MTAFLTAVAIVFLLALGFCLGVLWVICIIGSAVLRR